MVGRLGGSEGQVAHYFDREDEARRNYLLAATQLGRYLREYSPDRDADHAANDPCAGDAGAREGVPGLDIETRRPPPP
jgi:hypothetical protein